VLGFWAIGLMFRLPESGVVFTMCLLVLLHP
jgi:hypothetical protein